MTNPPRFTPYVLNGARLKRARTAMGMSQAAFAEAINEAVAATGRTSACNRRSVQHWEHGAYLNPQLVYQNAIEVVLGLPYGALCDSSTPIGAPPISGELREVLAALQQTAAALEAIAVRIELSKEFAPDEDLTREP